MTQLIIALDTDLQKAWEIYQETADLKVWYKIGLRLMVTGDIKMFLDSLRAQGRGVFWDGKYLDIPSQVGAAVATLRASVDLISISAHGSDAMVEAAVAAGKDKIISVGPLTSGNSSFSDWYKAVRRTADLGVIGVVCPSHFLPGIKKSGWHPIVTTGIRPTWHPGGDDHQLTRTPADGAKDSDFIVVGRPITTAKSPREATERILEEMAKVGSPVRTLPDRR